MPEHRNQTIIMHVLEHLDEENTKEFEYSINFKGSNHIKRII